MRVLIIPEDRTRDQYIAKPVVERMFESLERAATVEVLADPHLRGIDDALDQGVVRDVIEDNRMVQMFILLVDRDCDRENAVARAAEREREHSSCMLTCLAVEEIEVWLLAVQDAFVVPWSAVRGHCDPKEAYALPFLREQGWSDQVGDGYKRAMRELSGKWATLASRCPEVADLTRRVEQWLAAHPAQRSPMPPPRGALE